MQWTMYILSITRLLVVSLLVGRLAESKWTFSLWISIAHCCDSPVCGETGTCDDLFMAMCFRDPGYNQEDRHTCPLFVAGNSSSLLLDRNITSEDEVDANLMKIGLPYVDSAYEGGVQLFLVLLTIPDFPPFNPDTNVIDEWFVELERAAGDDESSGDGESSVENVTGIKGNVVISLSFCVGCYEGYSGDDCSCEGVMDICSVSSTLSPSPTPTCESPAPTDSLCDKPTSSLVVPVSAAGGGLVLLLLILVALALLCLIYRRRRDKKSYRFDLSHLTVDVMKEPPPPTIPPSDFVRDGVTYTHVMHDEEKNGYPNSGYRDEFNVEEMTKEEQPGKGLVYADLDHNTESPPSAKTGLVYADLDHEWQPTSTTFKNRKHEHKPPISLPSQVTTEALPTEYVTIKEQQPHKYMNVHQPMPRDRQPHEDQNVYSTLPAGI